ncbi:glutamine-synthetase adenylyltransferase [Marivivens marinus]|uniref:[protein-PII] uridylyltransferase family protein n=1 Tax=Marivivens marinus TaxID=3110173 RepID=UPI003B84AA56
MTFESRLTRSPDPFDTDRGAEARAQFSDLSAPVQGLINGAAGCSPYLSGLLSREADWIRPAFDDPEGAMDALLAEVAATPYDSLAPDLRCAKRRVALLAGLADLGGVWPLEQVTQALTDFADAAVDVCLKRLTAAHIRRKKLPGFTEDDAETACGMVALAMGKMGAGELNYSSDIDLIMLFDQDRLTEDTYDEARMGFVKITRLMTGILADVTAEGYVFRTDLRLRPDASVTPVCLSMGAAESYYEGVGRTWERAAYIKARPCAGDIHAGAGFIETLRPFIWRKHLDFAAIQDAHDMRLRIRDHKGLHGPLSLDGHNMKLGRGGIREIEFFTQTRQLIAGGRDPKLRVRGTKAGLEKLAASGWVPEDHAAKLYDHYRFHREVEHRVQMVADQQTHHLPTNEEGWARLASFMGRDVSGLRRELTDRIEDVHALTEGFFAPGHARTPKEDFGAEITARWPNYPALRSARAVEIFNRLRPEIMGALAEAAKPEEALLNFDGFLAGLPAGVQLFSLFEANPQLTRLVVDVCATAPALAAYLSRNADVFDMVIGGGFFSDWPGAQGLVASLTRAMSEAADYEDRLNMARRWMKEWHFRVGVHHLRGLIDATEAGRQYADIAEATIAGLWPVVVEDFSAKHGAPPGRGGVMLGMGSLGAARLNAASDLDLIMIYDADGVEGSEGRRPLATRPYYARLTQALVTAVTAPMSDGRLYEVDMRLRPSGRQGPVATSFTSFQDYQRTEAWTWEHLALTRARPIAGNMELGAEVETFRQELLRDKAGGESVLADVADMRARIAAAKPPQGDWDAKIGPGRLQDVELAAQTVALQSGSPAREIRAQLAAGVGSGRLSDADAEALSTAAGLFWQLQASARLLTGGELKPEELGEAGRRLILRETGYETTDRLLAAMGTVAETADAVISRLLSGAARETNDDKSQGSN